MGLAACRRPSAQVVHARRASGLLADLVYTFGFALWTAAAVVVLLEVIPQVKRRQIRRMLDYEATRRNKVRREDAM